MVQSYIHINHSIIASHIFRRGFGAGQDGRAIVVFIIVWVTCCTDLTQWGTRRYCGGPRLHYCPECSFFEGVLRVNYGEPHLTVSVVPRVNYQPETTTTGPARCVYGPAGGRNVPIVNLHPP